MTPGSAEWRKLITASKVAAILGVSPWESPRSVWHLMHGDTEPDQGNDATRRGQYLEAGVLAWWRDRHDIGHDEGREYVLQPTYKLGAWAAATPDMVTHVEEWEHKNVLVEAKTAAYDDDWGRPGTDEVPTYYLVQAVWQMHVSGIHRCYMPVLTSRLRFAEYVIDYEPEWGAATETRMRAFYDSLVADAPPPLDDTTATYESMRRVHPDIDADATVELDESLAVPFLETCLDVDDTAARDRLYRSRVLEQMGRARFATCNGIKVARRQANKSGVSFVPLPKNLDLITAMETAS